MLHLQYNGATTIPLEAECLTPDHLIGKSLAQIAAMPVFHGNRETQLGDWFTLHGDSGDGELVIDGDCSRIKWIGAEMTRGRIRINGDAGMHLGSEMSGGVIDLMGNAGDWVGAEMRGGRIHIRGRAGHLVGAVYRGGRKGMRGGTILIEGDAGDEVSSHLR